MEPGREQERPIQQTDLPAQPRTRVHNNRNIVNQGNSRSHFGDHYGDTSYTTNVNLNILISLSRPAGSSPAEQRQRADAIAVWLGNDEVTAYARLRAARGTLAWFFEHSLYTTWLNTPASAVVLQGNVGCGKTTLVNSIDRRLNESFANSGANVVTFYCGNRGTSTTCAEQLLRAILIGVTRTVDIPVPLLRLYERHSSFLTPRQPSTEELESVLFEVLSSISQAVYLLVDALDEVSDAEKPDVIDLLIRLANERYQHLRLLLVNRTGAFLRRFQTNERWRLETIPREQVRLDIARFVKDEIERRESFYDLEAESHDMILSRLVHNNNDQFRWAKLQLDRLSRLTLTTQRSVRDAVNSLPKDLATTYDSILIEVLAKDSEDRAPADNAKAALQLLAFVRYPLYIEEFLDAMAIMVSPTETWRDARIGATALLRLLPGMVELSPEPDWSMLRSPTKQTYLVRFEHFSVEEYVIGEHIRRSPANRFALELGFGNRSLADACLVYIYWAFHTHDDRSIDFAEYAWLYWIHHLQYDAIESATSIATTSNDDDDPSRREVDNLLVEWCHDARRKLNLSTRNAFDSLSEALATPFFTLPRAESTPDHLTGYYYSRLPADHFRLLSLRRARFPDSPNCGSLATWPIDDPPPYVALSCFWGSTYASDGLYIGKHSMRVPRTLQSFLREIAHRTDFTQLAIWADAICINQDDRQEKATQIKQMGNIYRDARLVIAQAHAINGKEPDPLELGEQGTTLLRMYGEALASEDVEGRSRKIKII